MVRPAGRNHPGSEIGPPRRGFSLVVLATLGVFGLVGVVLLQPDWIGSLLGHDVAAHVRQHFRSLPHRVHDITFSLIVGTAAVGMLAQLRNSRENAGGQVMALIPWAALILIFALTNRWVFAPLPILAALTLLATILHPAGGDVFRSFSVARVSWMLLGLVGVAAVPLLLFAFEKIGLQRTVSNDHTALGHYGFMAAFSVTVVGVGLLASLRPEGWRLVAWVAGALPALLGLASLAYPAVDSRLAPVWALGAIAWGAVFVTAAELIRRERRVD